MSVADLVDQVARAFSYVVFPVRRGQLVDGCFFAVDAQGFALGAADVQVEADLQRDRGAVIVQFDHRRQAALVGRGVEHGQRLFQRVGDLPQQVGAAIEF